MQRGYTLVELMIAMVIGLMLMAGVIQVLVSTKETFSANDDLARIQENGRAALDILVRDIRMAGFRDPANGDSPAFFLITACSNLLDPCTDNGDSDRIAVQYDPDDDVDCIDTPVGATDVVVNVYSITTDDYVNSLSCRGWNETTGTWIAERQILIDGIDNMQILYGIAVDDSVSQYISADRVSDWSAVKAVRIGLLVSNGRSSGQSSSRQRDYVLLDSAVLSFTDQHNRRIYDTTVVLNNAFNG